MRSWAGSLTAAARESAARPQRLLVYLNPFGGQKKAWHVWATHAYPIFQLAGVCQGPVQRICQQLLLSRGDPILSLWVQLMPGCEPRPPSVSRLRRPAFSRSSLCCKTADQYQITKLKPRKPPKNISD